jgi:hypothetical protein
MGGSHTNQRPWYAPRANDIRVVRWAWRRLVGITHGAQGDDGSVDGTEAQKLRGGGSCTNARLGRTV